MLGEEDADGIYAYEIEDRPGVRLCLGIPRGQKRPAIWLSESGRNVIVGRFNGRKEMMATVNYLDTLIGTINRVVDHYRQKNGDQDDHPYTQN